MKSVVTSHEPLVRQWCVCIFVILASNTFVTVYLTSVLLPVGPYQPVCVTDQSITSWILTWSYTGQAEAAASYLQAILAEFLFPVNSASFDALNSMSLFTSSSVTGGQRSTVSREPWRELVSKGTSTYSCRSSPGRRAAGSIPAP